MAKQYYFKSDLDKFKEEEKSSRAVFQGSDNYLEKRILNEASAAEEKEDPEVTNRLKALCANWLRMQNVVCLIGSGASADAGCLLGSMRNIVEEYLKDKNNLQTVFKKFFPEEEKNFEHNLSRLVSFSKSISDYPELIKGTCIQEDINELIKIIQSVIFYCCNLELPHDEDNGYKTHKQFIRKLIGRTDSKLKRVKLVTTNYDTLLEQAMDSLGVLYMDGFTGIVNRKFDTSCYGLDYYYPGEQATGDVTRYDKFLHLYKIHGSINWWAEKDKEMTWKQKENLPKFCKSYSQQKPINPLLIEMINSVCKDLFSTVNPNKWLDIQPTSIKYSETLNMPYSHLFRYFANALKEPQTVCFVIGYSFGDTHINSLIYDALANPSFNLVVVSPSLSKEIKDILTKEQLERVFWFGGEFGKFETFVRDLMPDLAEIETEIRIQKMLKDLKKSNSENSSTSSKTGGESNNQSLNENKVPTVQAPTKSKSSVIKQSTTKEEEYDEEIPF